MKTLNVTKFVKEIKAEMSKNNSSDFYPLSNREIDELFHKDYREYNRFISSLIDALKADKKVYKVSSETDYYSINGDWRNSEKIIYRIICVAKPCKEFISLTNWLNKYSTISLPAMKIHTDDISGKRSSYSADYCAYFMHNSNKCKNLLENLRKVRGTNDRITSTELHHIYWGDRFNSYGEDMECEWSGEESFGMKFFIKTPTGRLKKEIDAWA